MYIEHADASVLDAQAELEELYAVGLSRRHSDRRLLNELGALGTTWTTRCGTRADYDARRLQLDPNFVACTEEWVAHGRRMQCGHSRAGS